MQADALEQGDVFVGNLAQLLGAGGVGGNRRQDERSDNRSESRPPANRQHPGQQPQRRHGQQPSQPRGDADGNRRENAHPGRPQGQSRRGGGGNGRQNNGRGGRQEPRVPAYGLQPAPPRPREHDDERQPAPERSKNQLFPAFFGLFNRKSR